MAISKLTAGVKGAVGNSTGADVASSVNDIVDMVESVTIGNQKLRNDIDSLSPSISSSLIVQGKFLESVNSTESFNYIVTGDSTRSNTYNGMIPYYIKQLAKVGWSVVNNAESGLKTAEWNASTRDASVNSAILATPNDGSNTVLEYSLGINDTGTDAEKKADFISGINTYLAAKPNATVVLVSPVGSISIRQPLTGIYKDVASELGLDFIDGSIILDAVSQDSKYMADAVHPNIYGSKRVVNGILSKAIPPELKNAVTMEDDGVEPLPSTDLNPVVQGGYWSVSNGSYLNNESQLEANRSLEKIAVEPNFMLKIDHGGNMFHCIFYDVNGDYINWASSVVVSGNEREVLIPNGAYFVAINVSSDGAAWDSLSYPVVVEYKISELQYLTQPEINKDLIITLPYLFNSKIDSAGKLPVNGQVATGQADGSWLWV